MSEVFCVDWTLYFADDIGAGGGMKQIKWTGTTGTTNINVWYSQIIHIMQTAENNTADDTTPLRAVTPTEYEIGAFDQGDKEGWFIDSESIKHLTGGSLKSISWTRVVGSVIGIIKIVRTGSTNIVETDVGAVISHDGDGDSGILLAIDGDNLWIRPDDDAAGNSFDSTAGTAVTCNAHSDNMTTIASTTGEMIWSNIFKIGTTVTNTTFLVAQNNVEITNIENSGSETWWAPDTLDVLILTTNQDSLIDNGLITIYARQYSSLYDQFVVDASAGGRNPVPLSASNDGNNNTGNRDTDLSSSTTTNWTSGDRLQVSSVTRAILTGVSGSDPTATLEYYLVGDLIELSGTVTNAERAGSGAVGTPGTFGPSDTPGNTITLTVGEISFTFQTNVDINDSTDVITLDTSHTFITGDPCIYTKDGGTDAITGLAEDDENFVRNLSSTTISLHTTRAGAIADTGRVDLTGSGGSETHRFIKRFDVNDDTVTENFSYIVNGQGLTLEVIYERLKHIIRRGETTTINGIEGQQFIGIDFRIEYTGPSATALQEGELVTQTTSGATGFIVHNSTIPTDRYLMLRDSQGTFDGTNVLTDESSNTATASGTPEAIVPLKVSTFGTLAGGRFFGGRGLYLENMAGGDANSYELIDDTGTRVIPPATRNFTVSGLQSDSEVRIHKVSDDTEIDGVESSGTSFNHQFIYTGDVAVYIIILHINYNWLRIDGQSLEDQDTDVPVFQIFDRDYLNPL